jgi:hypothetical protein
MFVGWTAAQLAVAPPAKYRSDWIPTALSQKAFNSAMSYVIQDYVTLYPTPRVVVELRKDICTNPDVLAAFRQSAATSKYPVEYHVERKKCHIK